MNNHEKEVHPSQWNVQKTLLLQLYSLIYQHNYQLRHVWYGERAIYTSLPNCQFLDPQKHTKILNMQHDFFRLVHFQQEAELPLESLC